MVFIYILKLQKGKYYIGKTSNLQFRLEDHFLSNGSVWTNKYTPIEVIDIIKNCDDYDEDKYTIMYMDKYGINNVRGGSFTSIELDNNTIIHLEKMSRGSNNKCFNCGSKNHFAKDCDYEEEYDEEIWCCEYCDKEFETIEDCEKHEKHCNIKKNTIKCKRCGRNNHTTSKCYASIDVNGHEI